MIRFPNWLPYGKLVEAYADGKKVVQIGSTLPIPAGEWIPCSIPVQSNTETRECLEKAEFVSIRSEFGPI